MKFVSALLSLGILSIAGLTGSAHAGELTVEVSGVSQTKGEIQVALFNQKGQWLRKPLERKKAAASAKFSVTFENLPEGEYAISVFHDVNGNDELDKNMIGIPSEPYGFSNDATVSFGPPSFDDAKFKVSQDKKKISIRLN